MDQAGLLKLSATTCERLLPEKWLISAFDAPKSVLRNKCCKAALSKFPENGLMPPPGGFNAAVDLFFISGLVV